MSTLAIKQFSVEEYSTPGGHYEAKVSDADTREVVHVINRPTMKEVYAALDRLGFKRVSDYDSSTLDGISRPFDQ